MSAEMNLDGFGALVTRLNQMHSAPGRVETKALKAGAVPVQQAIARHAPRSNLSKEHLADNILISPVKNKGGVKMIEIGPTKGDNSQFFYGKFQEWGTSKMAAQPFVGPGWYESRREARAEMVRVVTEALRS